MRVGGPRPWEEIRCWGWDGGLSKEGKYLREIYKGKTSQPGGGSAPSWAV